ncbi:hypothetical protein JAAARDRAFT_618065 [Jaapia argillacea MUCL 33604]|uniref:Uncharacterized protein n=1 Tax=Jaapia argillacea MUCL 33604 TaxID=933084 RepID=A0A067P425_9AGAM|nr:hypothetical protein JAAARDRAFT_618065 [Jaapia argillacea MUCL 33604]
METLASCYDATADKLIPKLTSFAAEVPSSFRKFSSASASFLSLLVISGTGDMSGTGFVASLSVNHTSEWCHFRRARGSR